MFGKNFPISDYYKDHIVDARTIKRSGQWWSAVILIKDPKSENKFLNFYKWQKTGDQWKIRFRFKVKNLEEKDKIIEILNEFGSKLPK